MVVYGIYYGDEWEGFRLRDRKVYINIQNAVKEIEVIIKREEIFEWKKEEEFTWKSKYDDTMKIDMLTLVKDNE